MGSKTRFLGKLLALMLVVGACIEGPEVTDTIEHIVVPNILNFGPVLVGTSTTRKFEVRNDGIRDTAVLIRANDDFSINGVAETLVAGGTRVSFLVQFTARKIGNVSSTMYLQADRLYQIHVEAIGVAGQVVIDQTTLDFGDVPIYVSRTMRLTFGNPGSVPVPIVVMAPAGPDADQFQGDVYEISVSPGSSVSWSVAFTPTRLGPAAATVTISPCPTCPNVTVPITGRGVAAVLSVDPPTLSFGFRSIDRPTELRFRLINSSFYGVSLTAVEMLSGDDFVASATLGDIDGGAERDIVVTFKPTEFKSYVDTVRLRTNDPRTPVILVPVEGSGGGPKIYCAPLTLDFGTTIVRSIETRTIQCRNIGTDLIDGTGALELRSAVVTGDVEFHPVLPGVVTLFAGQAANLQIQYRPVDTAPDIGTLRIGTNDPASPIVQATLRGAAREAQPCEFVVTPEMVSFGLVAVGATLRLGFAIENRGTDDCIVSDLTLIPASDQSLRLLDGSIVSATIPAGGRLVVPIEFAPLLEGPVEGAVEFYVNRATDRLGVVPIVAMAGQGCLTTVPSVVTFGEQGISCGAVNDAVTLRNDCTANVTIDSFEIVGTSTDFTATLPTAPHQVAPGESIVVPIQYSPYDEGWDFAALQIFVDGATIPLTVSLDGSGRVTPTQTDLFQQTERPLVDVLFVMDNSGSMMEEQDGLARGFTQFLDTAIKNLWDYHIAVTTTGIRPASSFCPGGAAGGEGGRFFPVDGSRPRIITLATPAPIDIFNANIRVGLCHWWEEGLEAAYLALSAPLIDSADDDTTAILNDGNVGFLRADAKLSVIYISDENDYSPRLIQTYIDQLRNLKRSPDLVSASAIISDGTCTTAASAGYRYQQIVHALGGVEVSICTPDWNAVMKDIANVTFTPNRRFALSRRPVAGTVQVRVGEREISEFDENGTRQWSYDDVSNEIVLANSVAPPPLTVVTITYQIECGL